MSVERNKSLVRRYFDEVHNRREVDVVDDIFTPELAGPTRTVAARMVRAFPDYRIEVDFQLAEGEAVTTLWTLAGTHEGPWESPIGEIEGTGKAVSYTGSTTFRIDGGKIVEVLGSNHDHLGLLQQMGALPRVTARPGA